MYKNTDNVEAARNVSNGASDIGQNDHQQYFGHLIMPQALESKIFGQRFKILHLGLSEMRLCDAGKPSGGQNRA